MNLRLFMVEPIGLTTTRPDEPFKRPSGVIGFAESQFRCLSFSWRKLLSH